jgi:hypothetical protein
VNRSCAKAGWEDATSRTAATASRDMWQRIT